MGRQLKGERRERIDRILSFKSTSMLWIVRLCIVWRLTLLSTTAAADYSTSQEQGLQGTLLFLHVWKCGGTTLRALMCDWAKREGLPCATVAGCNNLSLSERKICLQGHKLISPEIQGDFISKQRVLAGHFRWGFQVYAAEPHLLVTTLRNPLELFVSGEQYLNRRSTSTLEASVQHVESAMRMSLAQLGKRSGCLHRLVGRSVTTTAEIREATVEGAQNLRSFWLVGVVEQYNGFIYVLQALLDPAYAHADLWEPQLEHKLNVSPVRSSNVLAGIDPHLVQEFNSTLSYEWLIYGHAARLFTARCQDILPEHLHGELCRVPSPPAEYV